LNAGGWTVDRLMAHMSHDKKVEDGKLTFILANRIGQAFISRDVQNKDVRELLDTWLKNKI
jgi:3-dehydroquinate synthase